MLTMTLDTIRRVLSLTRRDAADSEGFPASRPAAGNGQGADLIFRLKAWPQLPESGRTAEIYRMLSVMSSQPVTRQWLLARCSMAPRQLDALLEHLVADGALEVIDPALFAGRQPARA
ncbi:hypothetical protein [Ramlibacter pallidus]|uniref:Uncharacterized protein n=1 Tax=Ramlibacter pallidus TaxID=2780087 RepID=A0ABR9S7W5_9BURK|nr:hypothetical protein [Ramlibacter pallidus]MBE7369615.1 hypothetical protein [Ramlibacter pallidus]